MKKFLTFTVLVISLLIAGCGQRGASPRDAQTEALFRATIEGNTEMVKSLVSSPGADVNATNERGSTPLLEAARFGHDDILPRADCCGCEPESERQRGQDRTEVGGSE